MNAAYRCDCGRTLCEVEEEDLLIRRKGLMAVVPLFPGRPPYIRCDNCHTWHTLTNNRIMEPMTKSESDEKVGKRCIQCGAILDTNTSDASTVEVCRACGQPQTLTNPIRKQVRR